MDLTILITTWPRYLERIEYLKQTLESLKKVNTTNLKVEKVISSEVENSIYLNDLKKLTKEYDYSLLLHKEKPNIGSNLNFANSKINGSFILYIQDDFICNDSLNIIDDIKFLKRHTDYGLLRYYRYHKNRYSNNEIEKGYFEVLKDVNNYYSDNPHLKTKWFHNVVGIYGTKDNSQSEHHMNFCAKKSPIKIAMKVNEDPIKPFFTHIGRTSSMTEKWLNHSKNKAVSNEKNH